MLEQNNIPLYQQIKNQILQSIQSGEWKAGEQIKPELELSKIYSVSRVTIRKSLDDLVNEGYLIKYQGKGTFVNKPKLQRKIEYITSFSMACKYNDMQPETKLIETKVIEGDYNIRDFLKLQKEEKVLYTKRLRLADGEPIMLENNFYSYSKYKKLLKEDLSQSVYAILIYKYQILPFGESENSLEIVKANRDIASLLNVPYGEPLFYLEGGISEPDKTPIHYGKQYIIGSRYKFTIRS